MGLSEGPDAVRWSVAGDLAAVNAGERLGEVHPGIVDKGVALTVP